MWLGYPQARYDNLQASSIRFNFVNNLEVNDGDFYFSNLLALTSLMSIGTIFCSPNDRNVSENSQDPLSTFHLLLEQGLKFNQLSPINGVMDSKPSSK